MADAELRAVGGHPSDRCRAVVQPSRIRMHTQLAGRVTELHADDHEAGGREVLASALGDGLGGAENSHAAPVQVHDRRQRDLGVGGTADVKRDVITVATHDGHRRGRHFLGDRHALREDLEKPGVTLLHRGCPGEPVLQRRVDLRRFVRRGAVKSELREHLDHSRVGAGICAKRGFGICETAVGHGATVHPAPSADARFSAMALSQHAARRCRR